MKHLNKESDKNLSSRVKFPNSVLSAPTISCKLLTHISSRKLHWWGVLIYLAVMNLLVTCTWMLYVHMSRNMGYSVKYELLDHGAVLTMKKKATSKKPWFRKHQELGEHTDGKSIYLQKVPWPWGLNWTTAMSPMKKNQCASWLNCM